MGIKCITRIDKKLTRSKQNTQKTICLLYGINCIICLIDVFGVFTGIVDVSTTTYTTSYHRFVCPPCYVSYPVVKWKWQYRFLCPSTQQECWGNRHKGASLGDTLRFWHGTVGLLHNTHNVHSTRGGGMSCVCRKPYICHTCCAIC